MTTPVINTPNRIIRFAMENAGLLGTGQDPTSEQFAKYFVRLQDLVNLWQTQGLKLWLWLDQAVALTAGQAKYTVLAGGNVNLAKPMRALMAYYLDSSNNQRPLIPLAWGDYKTLSNTTNQGSVNSYFVDKQAYELDLYLWLTPDSQAATGTVHVVFQQQMTQLVALTDTMNFPQEWFMALHWGLADEIATGQPKDITDRASGRAQMYRQLLEDWDVEDASTVFQPDPRSGYYANRFK